MKRIRVAEKFDAELVLSDTDEAMFAEVFPEIALYLIRECDDGYNVFLAKEITLSEIWILAYRTGCREISRTISLRRVP